MNTHVYTQAWTRACTHTHTPPHTHKHILIHICLHIGIGATLAGDAIMYHLYTGLAKIDPGLNDVIIMSL